MPPVESTCYKCCSREEVVPLGQDVPQGQKLIGSDQEKLVAISSAAKVANKHKVSWEEKELQLMCTAVDESQFGNALVDCILVAE